MTPKPTGWDELHLAENPAVELLQSLGYIYVPPEDLESERGSFKEAILGGRLAAALKRLNPWLSESNVAKAVKAVKAVTQVPAASLAEANEVLYTSLTYGIALEQDRGDGRKSHTLRFLDFDKPGRNEWIVTRQYKVLGSKKHVIPDIVVFGNGLPLAVIECKSPTIGDTWKADAVKQLRRYQEADSSWKNLGAPKLFETAQVLIATCGERAVYGTVGTPERFFLAWREPYPLTVKQLGKKLGRSPTPQDMLLFGLLEPGNLLDVIRNFVVFDSDGGRKARKLTRYKQFVAVNEAMRRIRRARKPSARGGIVWHTQGSGKSLTMLWLALKLRRDESQQQPTVVIVTDRTKLDRQIAGVFETCGFPNPERADSVRDLRRILAHPTGKTVMTTIQKFQEITGAGGGTRRGAVHPTLSEAANIYVMVDEAHRTQYRSLAANMRQALPNACFLGFTGTPIDRKDRSTLRTFGPYIDTYTIEQAVQDGATVPIFYESRLPDRRALAYHADLRWLGKIRGTARTRYRDDRLDLSGCGEKVRKLIADAVAADGIQILVKEVPLFSPEFDKKLRALETDDAKASEMEHAIRHEINVHVEENPAFYQSLRERLEAIIEERRQQRLDAAEQLSLFATLREELRGEQTRAQDIGLDARGFAIYGLLERQRPMAVREDVASYNVANRDLASLIDEAVAPLTELVDWWQKDDLQRQMRSQIKRQLRASGVSDDTIEFLAADIVDLAKVRTDR